MFWFLHVFFTSVKNNILLHFLILLKVIFFFGGGSGGVNFTFVVKCLYVFFRQMSCVWYHIFTFQNNGTKSIHLPWDHVYDGFRNIYDYSFQYKNKKVTINLINSPAKRSSITSQQFNVIGNNVYTKYMQLYLW